MAAHRNFDDLFAEVELGHLLVRAAGLVRVPSKRHRRERRGSVGREGEARSQHLALLAVQFADLSPWGVPRGAEHPVAVVDGLVWAEAEEIAQQQRRRLPANLRTDPPAKQAPEDEACRLPCRLQTQF